MQKSLDPPLWGLAQHPSAWASACSPPLQASLLLQRLLTSFFLSTLSVTQSLGVSKHFYTQINQTHLSLMPVERHKIPGFA